MKRRTSTIPIDITPTIRTKPRLIAGACFLLIAIALSKARTARDRPVRTTVELRISEQWSLC